ncbi:hypothetical protein [Nocardia flavorosea]|uniref:Uncharacterized protein n=1 Tax=Nocardia flavorosea TaxID=53429 RepID=A0A846YS59_9NOCA|nr:hypothetical protein [Nocardia flavorosea]NKY60521.1 hypothetical protein [Nocardia flavorosea]
MTESDAPTRAVALLHSTHDPATYEALTRKHRLKVVYTVHTDATAVLAALIAVQYSLEHAVDAVVIPHLGPLEPRTPWWVVTQAADLITATRHYPLGSAVTTQTRPEQ